MSDEGFREWKTEEFLDLIMPDEKRIAIKPKVGYSTNNIIWHNILVYGGTGMGKSELIRWMAEQAALRYKPENMEAINVPRSMCDGFLTNPQFGILKKPIKVIFLDDLDGKKLKEIQRDHWATFRHIIKNHLQQDNGLLLTCLATQEYHALDKGLRKNINCFIAKSIPPAGSSPYDINLLKKFIGDEGYSLLYRNNMDKLLGREHEEIAVFRVYDLIGWFKTPLATVDYLKTWRYLR